MLMAIVNYVKIFVSDNGENFVPFMLAVKETIAVQ